MVRCERLDECSGGALIKQRYGDMATCVTRQELTCEVGLTAPGTSATPASALACAEALTGESCPGLIDNNPVPECTSHPGSAAMGAPCASSNQCQSAYCLVHDGQGCGTCTAPPSEGASCTMTFECGYNQACPTTTGKCTTYVQLNGACSAALVCAAGLTCNAVCEVAVGTEGAACDPKQLTAPACDRNQGLYCDPMSMRCAPITYNPGGQPCNNVYNTSQLCAANGLCVSGMCVDAVADGSPCNETKGPPCLNGARCVAGVCKVLDGASCH
jgi:hypothetical protein